MDKLVRVGTGAILFRDGRIVVGRRRGAHGPGMWSVPGGHLEPGESWQEGANREANEEVGLTMHEPRFVGVTNDISPNHHYITVWMAGSCVHGDPQVTEPEKFVDVRWVGLDSVPLPHFWCWANLLSSQFMPDIRKLIESS